MKLEALGLIGNCQCSALVSPTWDSRTRDDRSVPRLEGVDRMSRIISSSRTT